MRQLTALKTNKSSLANSGTSIIAQDMRLSDIKLRPEFQTLFPINSVNLESIKERMKKNGYDKSQPVHYWKEGDCLIDGHTRRQSAEEVQLLSIPAYIHSFDSIEDALEYALSLQVERRNLSDAELITAVLKLDKLKKRGKANTEGAGKSADSLASLLHTSRDKVEKIRAIENKADEPIKEAVKSGDMTINAAYNSIKKKPTLNKLESSDTDAFKSSIDDIISISEEESTTVTNSDSELSSQTTNEGVTQVESGYLKCVIQTLDALCFEDKTSEAQFLYDTVYQEHVSGPELRSVISDEQKKIFDFLFH